MPDIATIWTGGGSAGDWAYAAPDLVSGRDLETAVAISLGTDARAGADDVIPDGSDDRRGWVGDADGDRPIGSKLWLRRRSDITPQLLLTIADDMRAALQWMLDDGVVSTIVVETTRGGPRRIDAAVTLNRTGGPPVKLQYAWAWGG